MTQLQLAAACAMGLESIVAHELRELGYENLQVDNGKVFFKGTEEDICRTNLWLRTADRILIIMGQFEARTFEDLFEQTKAIQWQDWIPADGEFPVEGKSLKSQLSSVPACQSIVKKAIVEKLKDAYQKSWFEETGGYYRIEVALLKDQVTLTLDTTGASLHKRGYRKLVTEAPLKETLAAALIYISRWTPDRPLYDPFCGSGTIPIEAAMMGLNIAPGLRRSFSAESWHRIDDATWDDERDAAMDQFREDVELDITGSDISEEAIEVAEAAVKKAGLKQDIKLRQKDMKNVLPQGDFGAFITNPPYGERLADVQEAERLMRRFAILAEQKKTWASFIITPDKQLESYFSRPADKRRKLYNGRIECQFYQYFIPKDVFRGRAPQA